MIASIMRKPTNHDLITAKKSVQRYKSGDKLWKNTKLLKDGGYNTNEDMSYFEGLVLQCKQTDYKSIS